MVARRAMSQLPRRSFRKAIKSQQRCPQTITLDGYAASNRAVRELKADGSPPEETRLRSSKYLNNLIEQDHRGVKQRIAVMLGFKGFRNARSRSPALSCCTAFGRGSSDCKVSVSKIKLRLQSGMRASSLNSARRSKDRLLAVAICTRADSR
jgi:transposase-like protein